MQKIVIPNLNVFYLRISFLPLPLSLCGSFNSGSRREHIWYMAIGIYPCCYLLYLNAASNRSPEVLIGSAELMIGPFTERKDRGIGGGIRMENAGLAGPERQSGD